MKKIFSLLFLSIFLFTSCSGDQGPIGPQGPQGPQGPPGEDGLYGYTFEETIDMNYLDDAGYYSNIIDIPETAVTPNPDADGVLIYRKGIATADDGSTIDTWSLIPQNFFLEEGTIQYVYNHTANDVEIILEGNFDVSNLDSDFTDNQTFRIIVVPSDFAESTGIDVSNMQAVMNALNVQPGENQNEIQPWK